MFLRGMRARRKQKNEMARAIEKTVADLTCKYGTSWKRVMRGSFFTILAFSVIYWIGGRVLESEAFVTAAGEAPAFGFLNYFYYSILTFVTLGYGDLRPVGPMKLFSSIEALLGVIFIVLIVVVIARKWMR